MRVRFPILFFVIILIASSFHGLISQAAHAYRCKPLGTPLEELKEADAVFVGKVKKVNEDGPARITEFEVERYWKGASRKSITVSSGKDLYGYRVAIGKKYLVYGYGKEEVETSRCSRTKGVESAGFDLKRITQYSAYDTREIAGHHSSQIADIIGKYYGSAVVPQWACSFYSLEY